jgi:hypothetical protein
VKAITLYQPWASAIACGIKTHETRSWRTSFRGVIAIHAAKNVPKKIREEPQYWMLYQHVMDQFDPEGDFKDLPTACIVTAGYVSDCVPTEAITCHVSPYPFRLSEHDLDFGDYSPRRFAWRLTMIPRKFKPITCAGNRGLWDLPLELVLKVIRQITKE